MARTLQNFITQQTVVSAAWLNAVDQWVASAMASQYNVKSDGVTDDTANLNAAAAAISSSGGGFLFLNPGSTTIVAGNFIQQSNVCIVGYGCTIKLTSTGNIGSPATGALNFAGIFGVTIDSSVGTAPIVLGINSGFACYYKDLKFPSNSLTNVLIALGGNTLGTANPAGNLNTAQCTFENISQYPTAGGNGCGKFVTVNGNSSSQGIVTDNTFHNCQAHLVNIIGFEGMQWGDSNILSGMTRIGLNGNISPANGIAMSLGSTGGGIYSWNVQHFAVDTFNVPAVDNRTGVLLSSANGVKNIKIGVLFMGPQNEQNALVATNVLSYDITVAPRTTSNYQSKHLVGTNLGVGVPAIPSAALITGVGAFMSGAQQYANFAQGSAYNQGTPTFGACYGCQPGPAAFATPYTVAQIAGFYVASGANGANATTTNSYGFYCADQNYGSTGNYGYYSNLAAGAGKFNYYAAGTAPNVFTGTTAIGGSATNDSAAAGFVGEIIQSVIGSGSAVALTTATPANVTSISLTAGDWDVFGQIAFNPAATTTVTGLSGGSSSTSATLGGFNTNTSELITASFAPNAVITITPPQARFSLAVTTTIYLVAQALFGTSTMGAYGSITARRRR